METCFEQLPIHIVDDSEAERDFIARSLSVEGFQLKTFANPYAYLSQVDVGSPSVLIVDYQMPGLSGVDLLERIAAEGFNWPVIAISGYASFEIATAFMKFGTVECLDKPLTRQKLLNAVHRASEKAHERIEAIKHTQAKEERLSALTKREREVFDGLVQGQINKEISRDMGVSERTVEFHRKNLMAKIGLNQVSDLIALNDRTI